MTSPAPSVPVPVRPRRHRNWRQALIGWTFALPFVLLFGAFMAGPILISFVTSFTDMRITDIRTAERNDYPLTALVAPGEADKAAA